MSKPLLLPSRLWLTHNATYAASFHTHTSCKGLDWAVRRAEATGTAVEDYLQPVNFNTGQLLDPHRRFCRLCALQDATIDVFTCTEDDTRDVTCTVAAIPPQPPNAKPRAASDTATSRLRTLASTLGLSFVDEMKAGGVLYGIVPARAVPFLDQNFRISLPPPGTPMEPGVVATAWSLLTEHQSVDEDQWWVAAASVHT